MTVGVSPTNVANPVLNWLRGVVPAAPAGLYVQLHVGDPGLGTANLSANTTRRQATMNAASGGQITLNAMSGNYAFTTTETISHISVHSAATGTGAFLFSAALLVPKNVYAGDTLSMSTLTVANTPQAA